MGYHLQTFFLDVLLCLLSIPFMGYPNYYIKQIKDERNSFQFPLWDTSKLQSFFVYKRKLSIPFMGYRKCLILQLLFHNFQFPLWDTCKEMTL